MGGCPTHLKGEVAETWSLPVDRGVPQCWPPANRPWLLTPPVPPFQSSPGTSVQNCPLGTQYCREPNPQVQGHACVCVSMPCQEPIRAPAEATWAEGANITGLRWGVGGSLIVQRPAPAPHTCGTQPSSHKASEQVLLLLQFSHREPQAQRPSNWPQGHKDVKEQDFLPLPLAGLQEWGMVEMWVSWSKNGGGRAAFSCSHA